MKSNFAKAGSPTRTSSIPYTSQMLDRSLVFYVIAVLLVASGLFRFTPDEAQRLVPLLSSNALTSWLYLLFDARGAAALTGTAEAVFALLLMWRARPLLSILGGLGVVAMALTGLCSALLVPGVTAGFLLKDVLVAVAAMWAFTASLRPGQASMEPEHTAPVVAGWLAEKVEPVLDAQGSPSGFSPAATAGTASAASPVSMKEEQVRTRLVDPVAASSSSTAAELRQAAHVPSPLAMALFACVDRAEQRLHVGDQPAMKAAATPARPDAGVVSPQPAVGQLWPTLYTQDDLTASLERLTPVAGPRAGYAAAPRTALTRH